MKTVSTRKALTRGLLNRCPQCGCTKILRGYLTAKTKCENCELDYTRMRADDGPAWLTILVVGHLMVPIMFWVLESGIQSTTSILAILLPIVIALTAIILPRAKGVFMAIIWVTRVRTPLKL